jgi:hypothetical protein
VSEPTLLDALLDVIDTATDGAWDDPATLWFAAADPTADPGITIGHKVVDGHPYDHLVGVTAPHDWTVLGVTCCGWAGSLDAEVRPSRQPGRRRVRQTFLVGRSGATASVVRFEDGGEPLTEPPGTGRVLDALLRCLQLPTAPPAVDTPVLFTSWWLEAIVAVGRRSPKRLTWKQVCDHHPGVRMLRAAGERTLAGDVVLVGRAMARSFDWSRLRELFAENTVPGTIDPDVAAWMDEGMLSRHLLAGAPPVGALLPEALDHVTPATAGRLVGAVEELLGGRAAA